MSTAEQIIAEIVSGHVFRYTYDGGDTRTCGAEVHRTDHPAHIAAHVVDALTNAGKTIVELPEAINDDGQQVWLPQVSTLIAGVEPGQIYIANSVYSGEYPAGKVADLGLALLAAARVAEGGERRG